MKYFNDHITFTLSAVEMATIREALRYAAEQVHDSDIPVFESFEPRDMNTGELVFDEALYRANQAKADLAFTLADTLDLIEADGTDWMVFNHTADGNTKDSLSVQCYHYTTEDFGTPLIRSFVWSYVPKQGAMSLDVATTVLEDRVMPLNTQIMVHWTPYEELDDKDVVMCYDLDDLQNGTMVITGDKDIDKDIMTALRNFIRYHG